MNAPNPTFSIGEKFQSIKTSLGGPNNARMTKTDSNSYFGIRNLNVARPPHNGTVEELMRNHLSQQPPIIQNNHTIVENGRGTKSGPVIINNHYDESFKTFIQNKIDPSQMTKYITESSKVSSHNINSSSSYQMIGISIKH